ncbi:RINT-1 family protein [Suillus bovinus]|uniref:RINT-1 family protein n=1 Tax=Suillus bovinus TaxID=48563 RepID=UPI001B867FF6|nr:RINT-1 family protein [Suillus bovinus]KAG2156521.1 RINT-1 family protein [Suillus bovinus]
MSSQKIQRLLEPPDVSSAHRFALEFFNSNFAHIDDLDGIDKVLSETKTRSSELQRQLSASQQSIDLLVAKTRVAALDYLDTARGLAEDRESIENEMTYLSHELDIETMHRILKELESVRVYVAVIERTLTLSEGALTQLRGTPSPLSKSTTSEYSRLSAFVSDVSRKCDSVQDIGSAEQSLHLVTFVRRIRDKTWSDIKGLFSTKLNDALENLQWPMAVDYPAASVHDRKSFESAFKDLILLQEIGEDIESSTKQGSQGLYPLETLAHAISLRFKYHFETERDTNRLDKPEWYLSHIMNVVLDHRPFMDNVIQRLLLGTKYQSVNAWQTIYQQNYITLLVPILERKLRRTVPTLLSHPALLAHTVYQTLIFDSNMRELGYEFVVNTEAKKTEEKGGVSSVILGQKEWFDAWLEGEKKFAEDQYHEIISSPDAWIIVDDDSNDTEEHKLSRSELKATNSARRIKALVEQVTDRYFPLPSFAHRTRFLIHVQLPILEQYYSRVSSSLDAFETLSSALVRAVPGALGVEGAKTDSRKLTGGVEGSQRLCKALLSARYVEFAMQRWGEEEFFLELWTEINHRAALRSRAEMHPSLPHSADHQSSKSDAPDCTIFEELITQYTKLASRAEDMLVSQICGETETALKPHFVAITSPKDESGAHNADDGIAVPPSLLPSIALLSSHLTFLRNTLPTAVTTHVYRRIATRISEHILQREVLYRPGLTRGQFRTGLSREQARSVHAESELWAETCQVALRTSRARAEGPWARLLVAGRLLGAGRQDVDRAVKEVLGGQGDGWEDTLDAATSLGSGGLGKEEVKTVLRLRDDL